MSLTDDQRIARLELQLARLRSRAEDEDRAEQTRAAIVVGATLNRHAPQSLMKVVALLLRRHARPQDWEALERAGWTWALPSQQETPR